VVGPALVVEFLDYLTHLPVRSLGKQQMLAAITADVGGLGRRRAGSSINRTMAAVSSFYEFMITQLSRSMQLRVPMLAGPGGFLRWWVELGGSP
jgi:hypothetical protein